MNRLEKGSSAGIHIQGRGQRTRGTHTIEELISSQQVAGGDEGGIQQPEGRAAKQPSERQEEQKERGWREKREGEVVVVVVEEMESVLLSQAWHGILLEIQTETHLYTSRHITQSDRHTV